MTSMNRYWNGARAGYGVNGYNSRIGVLDIVFGLTTGSSNGTLPDRDFQLRRFPIDLCEWPSVNSDRRDIALDRDFELWGMSAVDGAVLPADEAFSAGSSDFLTEAAQLTVDSNSNGADRIIAPNPWLLQYWMGRYYKK